MSVYTVIKAQLAWTAVAGTSETEIKMDLIVYIAALVMLDSINHQLRAPWPKPS